MVVARHYFSGAAGDSASHLQSLMILVWPFLLTAQEVDCLPRGGTQGVLQTRINQEPMPWRQLRRNCLFQPPLSSQSAADWGRQSKEERNGRHFPNVWGCSAFREDRLFMSHASFSLELAIWLLLILAPWHGSSWMFMNYRTNHSAVLTKQIITHFPCYKLIAQVVNSNVYLL